MKLIVTGGAGFIGSAVCRHLVGEAGIGVVNVDCLTYAANLASLAPIADSPRYAFEKADIRDRAAMDAVMERHDPDGVIHLAAESHVDRSIDGPLDFVETNVTGTAVLLEAARRHMERLPGERRARFRFLHVSTDEVFGSLGADGLFHETSPYDPSSPYAASKAAADHLVRAWHRTYGFPALITNCSNNYGPYHFPEKLIPLMILNALDERPLPVYGDGSNVRDWLYVEDHARAIAAVFEKGRLGESYNIGARSERRNIEVVRAVCDILDDLAPTKRSRRELVTFVADRPGHDARYAIDPTRVETEIGWRARETFESGLARTVRWYLDNRDWWEPIRAGRYGGERLGLKATG